MRRVVWAIFGGVVAAAGGCQDPTQITLTVRTDAVCDDAGGTAITAGQPGELEKRAPATTTAACFPDADGGRIGSLVLVPSGEEDGPVGVKVAMSLGGSVNDCIQPPYDETCIIARRLLHYIPNTPLMLPVELNVDCAGKFCTELTTCVAGACVDATVDPQDCIAPSRCEPQGTGGDGGGGGGPDGCGPPTTDAVALSDPGVQRYNLAIAADAETCRWAVAWRDASTQVCMRIVGAEPFAAACAERAASIWDVDVTSLGAGVFALADWSRQPAEGHLATATVEGIVDHVTLENAGSGALAARNNTLLMVYEQGDGALGYAISAWSSNVLSPPVKEPLGEHTGTGLGLAWGATDAVVSWVSTDIVNHGEVMRFQPFSGSVGLVAVAPNTNIAVANHDPSGVTGIIFGDVGGNGALATWSPTNAYQAGSQSAVGDAGPATSFAITGTQTGWTVAFIAGGKGYLRSFDETAQSVQPVREVAADATSIAIAAIGDQLGVAWLDSQGASWFRRVPFDLAPL